VQFLGTGSSEENGYMPLAGISGEEMLKFSKIEARHLTVNVSLILSVNRVGRRIR